MNNKTDKSKANTFQIVEAYKNARLNLIYSLVEAEKKIIIISSSSKHEGKTTTAANLAVAIAQNGSRVLLIDTDMRKPRQHKLFKVSNVNGISNLIIDQVSVEKAIIKNVKPGLDLIPAGTIPPNPSELLGSKKMKELLNTFGEMYDYVLIDTPPINVVSDGLSLIGSAFGIVLVAKHKSTQYSDLQRAVESIKKINGKILGIILNDVRNTHPKDYYAYSYNEDED